MRRGGERNAHISRLNARCRGRPEGAEGAILPVARRPSSRGTHGTSIETRAIEFRRSPATTNVPLELPLLTS